MKVYLNDGIMVDAESIEPHTSCGNDVCRIWLTPEAENKFSVTGYIYIKYSEIAYIAA